MSTSDKNPFELRQGRIAQDATRTPNHPFTGGNLPPTPDTQPESPSDQPPPLDLAESSYSYNTTTVSSFTSRVPNPDFVYPFRAVTGLFVGCEDRLRPPEDQWTRWKNEIEPRLWIDVRLFQNKVKKIKRGRAIFPGMELDLRMSGFVARESGQVTLVPKIWILYNENRWKKQVRQFVSEMEWLAFAGFGPPEVHMGCPQMASLETCVPLDALNLCDSQAVQESGDYELYLHVENPSHSSRSACGLACCASLLKGGQLISQRVSRIGGLLLVDGDASGVTTAHGIVEQFWSELTDDEDMSDSDSDCSSDDDDVQGDEYKEFSSPPWQEALGTFRPSQVTSWRDVQTCDATGFLGLSTANLNSILQKHKWSSDQGSGTEAPVASSECSAKDFSLLELPVGEALNNKYLHPVLGKTEINSAPDFYPEYGPSKTVHLLLGPKAAVEGSLLPGHCRFTLHGSEFHTRKVKLSAPLAEGCSGTWVVDKDSLLGMIIASYPSEPYAHMITSTQLLLDVQSASPNVTSVKLSTESSTAMVLPTRQTRELTPPTDFGSLRAQAPKWNTPPLTPLIPLGGLQQYDGAPIAFSIHGQLTRGFFLADGDWACYRRNHFSCVVSFTTMDAGQNKPLKYIDGRRDMTAFDVYGFAMSISAVTSDPAEHTVELVQHLKRGDRLGKPAIVRLSPQTHETHRGKRMKMDACVEHLPDEHTFEHIQFKQATANNGKRRGKQEYYQVVVELWAHVGQQTQPTFLKIGQRKSTRIIVRGRSPGHYTSGVAPLITTGLSDRSSMSPDEHHSRSMFSGMATSCISAASH